MDRFRVEPASGPFDESELERVRERVLVRDSDFERTEARVQAVESKLNRIWYIMTVLGFLAWAWVDGRFGVSAPNAAQIAENEQPTTTILANESEPVEWEALAETSPGR